MTDLKAVRWLIAFVVVFVTLTVVVAELGANDDDPCVYQIQSGDTFNQLADRHGVTPDGLSTLNPHVVDRDRIYVGDVMLVCESVEVTRHDALLIPEHAQQWADAVSMAAPDWAERDHIRFLVAVAHFESSWCAHLWNPGDAGWENGVEYLGSYGCVQVRVRADGNPRHRNIGWLEQSLDHQAEAAWTIFGERLQWGVDPYTAWGPVSWTNGRTVPPKLPQDQTCEGSSMREQCEYAWQVADVVLASVG